MFACVSKSLVPVEVKRATVLELQTLFAMWVLGTKTGPLQGRARAFKPLGPLSSSTNC